MWWGLRATPGQLPKHYYLIPSVESRVTFVSADYHLLIQSSVDLTVVFLLLIFILVFSIETEQIAYIYTFVCLSTETYYKVLAHMLFMEVTKSYTIGCLQARHLQTGDVVQRPESQRADGCRSQFMSEALRNRSREGSWKVTVQGHRQEKI